MDRREAIARKLGQCLPEDYYQRATRPEAVWMGEEWIDIYRALERAADATLALEAAVEGGVGDEAVTVALNSYADALLIEQPPVTLCKCGWPGKCGDLPGCYPYRDVAALQRGEGE